jgi:high-affinity nickel permease
MWSGTDVAGAMRRDDEGMFGLDHALADLSGGGTLLVVLAISLLLGLRHASDPDHLAAVTTLSAGKGLPVRSAGRLGLAWGAGHATSLFALGLPIVLWRAYLPHQGSRRRRSSSAC